MTEWWDKQIQRADHLAAGANGSKALLTFYACLLRAQREMYESLRGRRDWLPTGEIESDLPVICDADPKGRNAGWTAYVYYGYAQVSARDARRFGARGSRSDLFSGNLQYKLNQWITFYEQGYYRTRATERRGVTLLPLFRGIPSYTTHNIRSEFAAIFNF